MPFSTRPTFILFFLLPTILYAGLITQFSFDFFTYDHLWKAYNSLALSILDGHLDIPYESIGKESFYYDGKVYMYYGSFPVLFRLLLAPFIDLQTVPLGKLFVFVTTTTGAASLQYAILKYSAPKNVNFHWSLTAKTKIIILSLIVWFGGAHLIIVQKGMMYHEVYAAMLMLSSIFIVLIWRDIFWDYQSRKYHLVVYACIAALTLHTRQTVAVALYLAVLAILCLAIIDHLSHNSNGKITWQQIINSTIKKGFLPLSILFIGGTTLLLLNYLRFDDLFTMTRGQYGYMRAGEIASERVCGHKLTGASRFELTRVIPNLMYYMVGGSYTHSKIINWLGLGYVRKENADSAQLILLWSSLLITFCLSTALVIKELAHSSEVREKSILLVLTTLSVGAILILAYTTITIRYTADLWLPLGFMLLVFANLWIIQAFDKNPFYKKFLLSLFSLSILINIIYSINVYGEYKKWPLLGNAGNGMPNAETIEELKNPKARATNDQVDCSKYDFNTEIWYKRLLK